MNRKLLIIFIITLISAVSIGLSAKLIKDTSAATSRFITPPGSAGTVDWRNIAGDVRITTGNLGVGLASGISPAYRIDAVGDIRAQGGWLRTTGATGWKGDYNSDGTDDGGWYMSDNNTIRAYEPGGAKIIYTGGEVQSATLRVNQLCISGVCKTAWP